MRRTDQRSKREARQVGTIIAGVTVGATLLVGFFIITSLFASLPAAQTDTVDNETFTVTFEGGPEFYTVSENGTDEVEEFLDNEVVKNNTGQELTEGTDYEWFPDNGTVRVDNTSAVDNNSDAHIQYSWTTKGEKAHQTVDRIGDGFLIGGVIVIVLYSAVILRVLRSL